MQELGPGGVEGLLGAALSGQFAASTVENVATELGSAPETVSSELGQTASQLPATATMLTAPVTGGKLLAIAPAVKGLAVGLLGGAGEEGGAGKEGGSGKNEAGSGEDKEGKSTGGGDGSGQGDNGSGQGAAGGAGAGTSGGAGGSSGGLTLVVDLPNAQNAVVTPAGAAKRASSPKIAILSSKTKGAVATIVLQVPAAGRLTLRGNGVRSSTRAVTAAKRVTLKVRLSRAGAASLRRRRAPLKVRLDVSFKSASGATSTATRTLTFK